MVLVERLRRHVYATFFCGFFPCSLTRLLYHLPIGFIRVSLDGSSFIMRGVLVWRVEVRRISNFPAIMILEGATSRGILFMGPIYKI